LFVSGISESILSLINRPTFHANSLATSLLYSTTYGVTTESSIPYSALVSAPFNLGILFGFCISRRARDNVVFGRHSSQ
jgi:hypothetical protein